MHIRIYVCMYVTMYYDHPAVLYSSRRVCLSILDMFGPPACFYDGIID